TLPALRFIHLYPQNIRLFTLLQNFVKESIRLVHSKIHWYLHRVPPMFAA
ncbi:hypothetical protein L9F63_019469, partial [Diploptera punctata]